MVQLRILKWFLRPDCRKTMHGTHAFHPPHIFLNAISDTQQEAGKHFTLLKKA
jgi:hypothetical protein